MFKLILIKILLKKILYLITVSKKCNFLIIYFYKKLLLSLVSNSKLFIYLLGSTDNYYSLLFLLNNLMNHIIYNFYYKLEDLRSPYEIKNDQASLLYFFGPRNHNYKLLLSLSDLFLQYNRVYNSFNRGHSNNNRILGLNISYLLFQQRKNKSKFLSKLTFNRPQYHFFLNRYRFNAHILNIDKNNSFKFAVRKLYAIRPSN